eukprot:ANDGO_08624.mRNA.1 hypothetical protein H257_10831
MLLRKFIQKCLYDPRQGYFSGAQHLFQKTEPIQFHSLRGQEDYLQSISSLYRNAGWTTPSEIFAPWYGIGVAKKILSVIPADSKPVILEIGGGNGSLAESVISEFDRLHREHEYHIVELSDVLHKRQRLRFAGHPSVRLHHGDGMRFDMQSMCSPDSSGDQHTLVLLLFEVLDNLQHDCIRLRTSGEMQEAHLTELGQIVWKPLEDAWIHHCIPHVEHLLQPANPWSLLKRSMSRAVGDDVMYVPTGLYELLWNILKQPCIPKSVAGIIADFDAFPNPMPGILGPVIQAKSASGKNIELNSWSSLGARVAANDMCDCDVMFPTNFPSVESMLRRIFEVREMNGVEVSIQKHSSFFQKFPEVVNATRTLDGFNPLHADYENMSVISFTCNAK